MNEAIGPRPVVGVGVVVLRSGHSGQEVLLVRRGKAPRAGEWSIPGGHQELGETVKETAAREVREETGVSITNLRLIDVVDAFRRDDGGKVIAQWTLVDFRGDWTGGEAVPGDDAAEVRWVAIADLAEYGLWRETLRIIETGAGMAM